MRAAARTLAVGGLLVALSAATSTSWAAPQDPESDSGRNSGGIERTLSGKAGLSAAPAEPTVRRTTAAAANAAIAAKLRARLAAPDARSVLGSEYSYQVVDVGTGVTVSSRDRDTARLPASNMKLLTAAAALRTFGPNHRFNTDVLTNGRGGVFVRGGGDPALTNANLDAAAARTADALRASGRRGGSINVFVDSSAYPEASLAPGWPASYVPSAARPVQSLAPDGYYGSSPRTVVGRYFTERLAARGFAARYLGVYTTPRGSRKLTTAWSSPTADIVKYMLLPSENNVAEHLFRNVAMARGVYPDWANSSRAVRRALDELGVDTRGLNLADGSGLSRDDRVTAVALTTVLRLAADRNRHPELAAIFYGRGLPTAGLTGTLSPASGRYVTPPTSCARGKIWAKTGTLFDTIALSGLTYGSDRRLKAFSVLVNDRVQDYPVETTRQYADRIAATVNGCY